VLRAERARGFFEFLNLPTDTIPRAHLDAIPADAYVASLARLDLGFIEAILDTAAEFGAPVMDLENQFREQIGLDLRDDILRTLGGSVGYYLSESTGGGGPTSFVFMSNFKDRETFLTSHARLVRMANDARRHIPQGFGRYIKLESWQHDGVDLMSLRFPGLPVPVEFSYAVTDEWLLVGLTPQAVITAAAQVNGKGAGGLLANPRFAERLKGDHAFQSFQVVDAYHTIRAGYPAVQLVGSALANMARSPHGAEREPGVVAPMFNDLRDGIKAAVVYSVWDGDDLISHGWNDRSGLAAMAAQFGSFGGGGGSLNSLLPVIMQAAQENRRGRGPVFMADPPVMGPVFASLFTSAPLPYAAAAAEVYAASLAVERTTSE